VSTGKYLLTFGCCLLSPSSRTESPGRLRTGMKNFLIGAWNTDDGGSNLLQKQAVNIHISPTAKEYISENLDVLNLES
jgi:hypothetical protein